MRFPSGHVASWNKKVRQLLQEHWHAKNEGASYAKRNPLNVSWPMFPRAAPLVVQATKEEAAVDDPARAASGEHLRRFGARPPMFSQTPSDGRM